MSFVFSSHLWRGASCLALLCALATPAQVAHAANAKRKSEKSLPTLVEADRLAYDQKTDTVTAEGHVEIAQGERVLQADKVTYNKKTDVVHAVGHVVMLQPDGNVVFAREASLTEDMKQGFVDRASLLFGDNSRLATQDARRYEGRYLIAEHAVYSACNLCAEHPDKAPLWQFKGGRVTHDNVTKDVIYRDAVLEFYGVPVFYTPYFSHPDPSVTRRQGFLMPSGGYKQTLGTFARVPYYFDIAPNIDATLVPTFSTEDKVQIAGEFRERFTHGMMQWNGSFMRGDLVDEYGVDQGDQWRGHLFGTTLFNLNDVWRTGTKVAFTSDKSYLPRYVIAADNVLTNRAYIEGFKGRNYAVGNMYYFQDLRPGAQLTEPFVAPDVSFSALGEPGKTLGGRWSLGGGLLVTTRKQDVAPTLQGPDTRRFDLSGGWERQLISSTGLLATIDGLARIDGYWAENVDDNKPSTPSDIAKFRQFAQSNFSLRYPMGRNGDSYQQIVEPIAVFSLAPQVSKNPNLPNEDSLDVNFDETNLFAPTHFTGIDRLEGGVRAAYGLRNALIGDNGARIEMIGGQIYRFNKDTGFPGGSGLRSQLSDYVGRFDFAPGKWFDTNYGFRLNSESLRFERQDIQASGGVPAFHPSVNYLFVNQTEATTGTNSSVEEVTFGVSSSFAKYWSISAAHTHGLQPTEGSRSTSLSLNYTDECFQIGITGQRDYTNRKDIASGDTILFHFYLKNLGGLHTDSVASAAPFLPTAAR